MKHYKVYLKLLVILSLSAYSMIACSISRADFSSPSKRSRPSEPSQELFRRIITKNIAPFVGNNNADNSPAIVVGLVTRKGEIVVGIGNREIYNNLQPNGDTLFGIGSISKLFTGLILAEAVTNSDTKLSAKANEWLDKKVEIDNRITFQHLVSHFSGLPNYPDNISERENRSKDSEIQRIMPAINYSLINLENCLKIGNCRPRNQPGQQYLYSNFGIGVLGIALQNHYGFNDFNNLMKAKITQPLNMHETSTNISSFLVNKTNIAQGYLFDEDSHSMKPVPFSSMGVLAGSGELISSANDMNKFLKSLTGLSHSMLSKATIEVTRELGNTDHPGLKIAYAHEIRQSRNGGKIHFKSGITAGYSAIILWRDNPKVGLIVFANRGKFRQLMPISNRLIEIIAHQLKND